MEDEKCQKLMKECIELKSRGEDIENKYAELLECRKRRSIYSEEEKDVLHKQFNMQQNFIKMIDKCINEMEKDTQFIEKARQVIRREDGGKEEIYATGDNYNKMTYYKPS